MLTGEPKKKCGVLYIDDEELALKYFRKAFCDQYEVFITNSGKEGIEILRREADNIGILISDQRMPEMLGSEVLTIARNEFPAIVRILTTAYTDLPSAVEAVNKGHIYQYVVKPTEPKILEAVLRHASDYHQALSERDKLMSLKMTTLQRILCTDRLKWLLLSSRYWKGEEKTALLRVLNALVDALPDTPELLTAGSGKFQVRHFEAASLIRDEYHNASRCLDAIDRLRADHAHAAESGILRIEAFPESLRAPLAAFALAQGNKAWRLVAADHLGALAASLIKAHGINPARIEVIVGGLHAAGVELRLSVEHPFSSAEFLRTVFGVLIERESGTPSLQLVMTLFALSMLNGSLAISVPPTETFPAIDLRFSFPANSPASPDEAIDKLAEKFAKWDISSL